MAIVNFKFKGQELLDRAVKERRVSSLHQASTRAGISYPTAHTWVRTPDKMGDKVQLSKLAEFLINGLGYTVSDIAEMKFSDIFEVENGKDPEANHGIEASGIQGELSTE